MFICESYFDGKEDNISINDISANIHQQNIDYNVKFDIYLKDVKSLRKFDRLLHNILDITTEINNYDISYRNYTITSSNSFDDVKELLPNCEKNSSDFELPFEEQDDEKIHNEYKNDIPFKIYDKYSDQEIYAHINIDMSKFYYTLNCVVFFKRLYNLCKQYLSKYNNDINFLIIFGNIFGWNVGCVSDISYICGIKNIFTNEEQKKYSLYPGFLIAINFVKHLNVFKYCRKCDISIPKLIKDIKLDDTLLGICDGSRLIEKYGIDTILNHLYISKSWEDFKNVITISDETKPSRDVIIKTLQRKNIKGYVYKQSKKFYQALKYYIFLDSTVINAAGCEILFLLLDENPLTDKDLD